MTFDEFMRLPLESRKKIEQAILDLDKAVQREYGFSMLDTEKILLRKLNDPKKEGSKETTGIITEQKGKL